MKGIIFGFILVVLLILFLKSISMKESSFTNYVAPFAPKSHKNWWRREGWERFGYPYYSYWENFENLNDRPAPVTDESEDVIWKSDDEFDFEEYEDDYRYNDGRYLLIEDYIKGNFFNYILETDEDFNPELLSSKLIELLDGRSELITDIKYDGQEMEKEYGDTSSKGFTYMLL